MSFKKLHGHFYILRYEIPGRENFTLLDVQSSSGGACQENLLLDVDDEPKYLSSLLLQHAICTAFIIS